jgi:hypothetical protein
MRINMKTKIRLKTGILFALLWFAANFCMGQNGYEDVVYLKNGSIIRGMIMEQIPNQTLKIQTADRNLFVFTFDQIEKITKDAIPTEKPEKSSENPNEYPRGRFTFILEGNIGLTSVSNRAGGSGLGISSLGGTLAFDVNIKNKLCIGLGSGYDAIDVYSFIPIFLDVRYFFSSHRFTPYLSAGLGYSVGPAYYDDGGFYANPNLGIRYNFAPKSALNFGIGWRLQTEKDRGRFYSFTMINVKVGAMF